MKDQVLYYSIVVFISQVIFIFCRTWNVKAIAKNSIPQTLLSGAFVHIAWLVSIAIGAISMKEILTEFQWIYTPIVACSLTGGLLGSFVALKNKRM